MKTTIYMVRHAESPYLLGEERTRGLSKEGFAAADVVADLLEDVQIDYFASSAYTRAIQTVQVAADRRGAHIEAYEELIERPIKGLDYEMSWEEIEVAIKRSFADSEYALEGGESTGAAQARAIPVIEQLLEQYRGQSIAIGTHGNIMTIIMSYYDKGVDYDFWASTSKPDIYKLTFAENQLESTERVWK